MAVAMISPSSPHAFRLGSTRSCASSSSGPCTGAGVTRTNA
ncbi:Uncharacterised protein [Bordetella pertussis]|nr:Uncharacterised protein [Bordetella pertussis]